MNLLNEIGNFPQSRLLFLRPPLSAAFSACPEGLTLFRGLGADIALLSHRIAFPLLRGIAMAALLAP